SPNSWGSRRASIAGPILQYDGQAIADRRCSRMTSNMTRREFLQVTVAGIMVGGLITACGASKDDSAGTIKTEQLLAGGQVAVVSACQAGLQRAQAGRAWK